jgi:hypothetical protein
MRAVRMPLIRRASRLTFVVSGSLVVRFKKRGSAVSHDYKLSSLTCVSFLNKTGSKAPVNIGCQHMITRYILLCGQTCDHCVRDF